jgi:hypothetical protein
MISKILEIKQLRRVSPGKHETNEKSVQSPFVCLERATAHGIREKNPKDAT